jgi:hypothetical protein
MMDTLLQDLRYALRALQKSPGFTAAVVLTLSLGIGANTAIFSIVNALLLRDLPHVTRPEALLLIGRTVNNDGFDTFSYPDYVDLRDQTRTFQDIAAATNAPVHVSGTAATERARGGIVSGNYFAVLGTSPVQGRFFTPDEDRPSNPVSVVVLSAGLWQRAFGGRADIIGKTIRIDNHPFEVIGVAPAGFQGLTRGDQLDLFLPLSVQPVAMPEFGSFINQREAVWLQLFGRLRPGASLAQARMRLRPIERDGEYPPRLRRASIRSRRRTSCASCGCCRARSSSCSASPVPMWRICSSCGPQHGAESWRFVRRSARDAAGFSGNW